MTILILGPTGATGKHLTEQLLLLGHNLKLIVRPSSNIPQAWENNNKVSIIKAHISEMSVNEMAHHLKECEGAASCLGHNMTFKGMFGKPRKLVTEAVKLLSAGIEKNTSEKPVRLVLMNTAGNRNRDLKEPYALGEKLMLGLTRLLLPPHSDNEDAADFLRLRIGQSHANVAWVAVRPDTLINQDAATEYELYVSPVRSALFNPGKTSRINVGHFMARLLVENDLWNQWKGHMPVIYNKEG